MKVITLSLVILPSNEASNFDIVVAEITEDFGLLRCQVFLVLAYNQDTTHIALPFRWCPSPFLALRICIDIEEVA